jgi:hypothetical protein
MVQNRQNLIENMFMPECKLCDRFFSFAIVVWFAHKARTLKARQRMPTPRTAPYLRTCAFFSPQSGREKLVQVFPTRAQQNA